MFIRSTLFLSSLLLLPSGCGNNMVSTTAGGAVYRVTPSGAGISATVVTQGGFTAPLDTVPSSDGAVFYFIAVTDDGKPGVFTVPAAGGAVKLLASGAPLAAPLGISISSDDKTLFVADVAAGLLQLPAAGGTPTALAGTPCMKPRGLDVASQGGADQIYFTTGAGTCGGAGLSRVPAAGGAVTVIAMGAPFAQPTGVAVATSGDVFVSNPGSDAAAPGTLLRVAMNGTVSEFLPHLDYGHPAGIALDLANTTLFASGHDATGHDQVYAVTLANKMIATFNTGIAANTDGGGLHRAARADIFAWADLTGGRPRPFGQ